MKKELIIVNLGVLSKNNPNAACMLELAKYLQKEFDIHFFTDNGGTDEIIFHEHGDIKIHGFPMKKRYYRNVLDLDSTQSVNYREQLALNNAFACIAVTFPFFTSVNAMRELKRIYPKMKTILYEFDPLAFNGASKKSIGNVILRIMIESMEFKKTDAIWLTRELYEAYRTNIYKVFKRKFVHIGIPLLSEDFVKNGGKSNIYDERKLQLVYTGTFYDTIRQPDYLIEMMRNLTKVLNAQLLIYGTTQGPNCAHLLKVAKKELGDGLINHGKVDRDQIPSILQSADILINVSNSVRNQTPSKIFEYIQTGKPIVNFFSIENDASEYYLRKHPLSLSILERWEEQGIKENSRRFIEFCRENAKKTCSASDLMMIYKDFTAQSISERALNSLRSLV